MSHYRDFNDLMLLCKQEKYDLVVLDTQSRIFNMERENDNAEANQIMSLLRDLANQAGCAVVLIHHTTKGDEGSGVYRGRGASAIAGAVDIVVNMEALDDEIIKLTVPKNRIVGANPTLLIRKAGEDRFESYAPPGESSGFEIFTAQDFINSLSYESEWSTGAIYELGKKENFSESTTKRALSKLVESGKWKRVKKGVYRKMARVNGSENPGIYPDPIDPSFTEGSLTTRNHSENKSKTMGQATGQGSNGVDPSMSLGHGSKSSGYIPDPTDPLTHSQNSDLWEREAKEFLEKVGGIQ